MKVLVISQNEFSYNPRILKSIRYFKKLDFEVHVLTGVTGVGDRTAYERIKKELNITTSENIIDKSSSYTTFRWFIISIYHKLIYKIWDLFRIPLSFKYILNKGLILAPSIKEKFDIIYINLVDSLPLACKIKNATGSNHLIYDSQEYFKGQYDKYEKSKRDWVELAEIKFIKEADIILATTNEMKRQLESDYSGLVVFRVRNLPYTKIPIKPVAQSTDVLKLIWHGMSINYGNCRGVHILLKAVSVCKTPVHLYLQGKIVYPDFDRLMHDASEFGVLDKLSVLSSVSPDKIVESLVGYDVGLTGELPQEKNQELTSSNKLFEYIHAGMAVISSDLPGLRETLSEYNIGLLYQSGDFNDLASKIDKINADRSLLQQFKLNSQSHAGELIWDKDFTPAIQSIIN